MSNIEGHQAIVMGKLLACVICGAGRFTYREEKMTTTGMTFMGMEWANQGADAAVCTTCGFVHTFFKPDSLRWVVQS